MRYARWMLARAAHVRYLLPALAVLAAGCASPQTVVHLSAPHETPWEARDAEGQHLCALPCTVELDEREAVTVARADGRTEFVLHQETLGPGAFSGAVRIRRDQTPGAVAVQLVSAALGGAGAALATAHDDNRAAAGAVLSGVGAAALAASDALRAQREELWVERSSSPE